MKIFMDFEFIEDGKTIDPISLGMVREDGKEYYAVFEDSHIRPAFYVMHLMANNEWLMDNVFPSLPYKKDEAGIIKVDYKHPDCEKIKTREQTKTDILDFTMDIEPEFWAWYGDYDHVALCQIFGRKIDLPLRFPMYTKDIKQLADEKGNPSIPEQPHGIHNALEDARHNKIRYEFLCAL